MGLGGQSIPSQSGPPLLRWEPRVGLGLFSRKGVEDAFDQMLSEGVRRLDASLRRRQGIMEFTNDPECILRLSLHHSAREIYLTNRLVRRGEPIGELHLWNEHILPMTPGGANMVWGSAMRRRLRASLVHLADFVQRDPVFRALEVFRGEVAFGPGKDLDRTRCFAEGFGFEIRRRPVAVGPGGQIAALGEAIFLWGMMRTFNRGAMRHPARLPRPTWLQLFMTRETLLTRYSRFAEKTK